MQGFIILARKIRDSEIWTDKPDSWLKIFLDLILEATFAHDHKYPRGSAPISWTTASGRLPGISRQTWNRCLRWMEDEGMIERDRLGRRILVHLNNYEMYQDPDYYKNTPEATTKPRRRRKPRAQEPEPAAPPEESDDPAFNILQASEHLQRLTLTQYQAAIEPLPPDYPLLRVAKECARRAKLEGHITKPGPFVSAFFQRWHQQHGHEISAKKRAAEQTKALCQEFYQILVDNMGGNGESKAVRDRAAKQYEGIIGKRLVAEVKQKAKQNYERRHG